MLIRVQQEDFDSAALQRELLAGRDDVGALATFIGLVRDLDDAALEQMTLEHYPGMTERKLAEIEAEACARWPLQASLIVHRYGRMLPGEPIVLVATASRHRAAALDSCAFLIDWLKTKAPFWKLEETPDGPRWVEARESDDAAGARWSRTGPKAAE